MRDTRAISWIRAALKDFNAFPEDAKVQLAQELTTVAEGRKPDSGKPLHGLGSGIWELALRSRGGAYRVVYALQLADTIWVIHAFQKKSKSGAATPKNEIDLVRERLKRIKEQLK
jgi:phage-related protein